MGNRLWTKVSVRVRQSLGQRSFNRVAKAVLNTAPLRLQGDSPLFVSMLCNRDLIGYLLAIKSLYTSVEHGKVLIINDGSLTPSDIDILRYHIPQLELLNYGEIETGTAPRADFFWERLIKIVELSQSNYVIQVDADTLVCDHITEVIECWRQNRSFLLGTDAGQTISGAPHTARMVRGWIETNGWMDPPAFLKAEASLDKLPNAAQRSYVHASAGFAGFARGAFKMADLEEFSVYMSELLGVQHWQEYGTEQIASNYILANSAGATVLPFPRYACFEPHLRLGNHSFLHFIGTYRYDGGIYRRAAAEFISRYNRNQIASSPRKVEVVQKAWQKRSFRAD